MNFFRTGMIGLLFVTALLPSMNHAGEASGGGVPHLRKRVIQVEQTAQGARFDSVVYQRLLQIAGEAVADGKVKSFQSFPLVPQGSQGFCLEAHARVSYFELENMVEALGAVRPTVGKVTAGFTEFCNY
jgi:hypothetical protein